MKKSILILCCLFFVSALNAQLCYYSADEFPLLGKVSNDTETRYERLGAEVKEKISRPYLWQLGKNTAGLAIRFRTNSKTIGAKWTLFSNTHMNHMAPTGTKGLDLYCLKEGKWKFINSGRPGSEKDNEATLISDMKGEELEYMLYLPLYDGVTKLEIGVDSLATIKQPEVESPKRNQSIVWYGTSITQGGCASRPGMAHTNILSRMLDREIINLGFSGNGRLDYEIAEYMVKKDAALFVLDCMPNVEEAEVLEKLEKFYRIIRDKHPTTPILFVQNSWFSLMEFSKGSYNSVTKKNKALDKEFARLLKADQHIYFQSSGEFLGDDGEATVDGIHFTDLGFMRCANVMLPLLKEILE